MKFPQNLVTGCPKCGVSVFVHDGRRYTPIREYLLTGTMVGRDRDLGFRRAYVEHRCRPEDLASYGTLAEDVVRALKQLIEDTAPQWLQSDLQDAAKASQSSIAKLREVTARAALTRACPRCNVGVGFPCENLLERKRGNTVATKNAHPERLPLPETVEATELNLAREENADAYGLLHQIQEAFKTTHALDKLLRLAERI